MALHQACATMVCVRRWRAGGARCSRRRRSLVGAGPARAATYKWVDEKGVVHYTDKMPPEAVDKASVELNKQGVPDQEDRAGADARAAPRDRAGRGAPAAGRAGSRKRSRAATARSSSSYTSEAEIDLARNRVAADDRHVIQSAQAYSEQLGKRKAEVEAKKAQFEGKPMVAALDRELESIDAELARQAELVAQKKREADGDHPRSTTPTSSAGASSSPRRPPDIARAAGTSGRVPASASRAARSRRPRAAGVGERFAPPEAPAVRGGGRGKSGAPRGRLQRTQDSCVHGTAAASSRPNPDSAGRTAGPAIIAPPTLPRPAETRWLNTFTR